MISLVYVFVYLFVMAAIVLSAEQKEAALKSASSDLAFLFDRKQVPEELQAVFYHIGVTNVEGFAVLAKNQEDLEELLGTHFGLDVKSLPDRIKASKVITAWLAAKARASKQAETEGDCEVRRVPKDTSVGDMAAMRTAFERKCWELEDKCVPGKSYMEKKLDEMEKNELRAEP